MCKCILHKLCYLLCYAYIVVMLAETHCCWRGYEQSKQQRNRSWCQGPGHCSQRTQSADHCSAVSWQLWAILCSGCSGPTQRKVESLKLLLSNILHDILVYTFSLILFTLSFTCWVWNIYSVGSCITFKCIQQNAIFYDHIL